MISETFRILETDCSIGNELSVVVVYVCSVGVCSCKVLIYGWIITASDVLIIYNNYSTSVSFRFRT